MKNTILLSNEYKTIEVKVGFSWTAFFFGFWIYFLRGMTKKGIFWLSVCIFVTLIVPLISGAIIGSHNPYATNIEIDKKIELVSSGVFLVKVIYSIFQGKNINDDYIEELKDKGFSIVNKKS